MLDPKARLYFIWEPIGEYAHVFVKDFPKVESPVKVDVEEVAEDPEIEELFDENIDH